MKVKILNWDKYNEKRKDVNNPTWLRLQNTMPQSMSLFGVPAAERYVFDCLLCLASQKQTDEFEFDPEWFRVVFCGAAYDTVILHNALRLLQGKVLETIYDLRNEDVTNTVRARDIDVSLQDVTRRDETLRNDLSEGSAALPAKMSEKLVSKVSKGKSLSPQFIGPMVQAYQRRYKVRPILDGPTQGGIKRLLDFVPLQTAIHMYEVYLQLDGNNGWFKTRCHDFATFMANLQTVAVALGTGEKTSNIDWGAILDDTGNLQIANTAPS